MTRQLLVLVSALALLGALTVSAIALAGGQGDLALKSSAFKANASIPKRFSCQGKSVSPPLSWTGVPDKAKAMVLIVDDPDAPSGTYVHWVVYNLTPASGGLAQGAAKQLPGGATTAQNSAHETGYHGMCPPSGSHRYRFKLYALDKPLDGQPKNKAAVGEAMQGHILAHAKLVASYAKQ